jgi:nuclear pore complex protein Nup98-Nup96
MTQEEEKFLVEQLHIPTKWIDEARAWLCAFNRDVHSQLRYLLKCERWNECHQLILRTIGPELLLKGSYK